MPSSESSSAGSQDGGSPLPPKSPAPAPFVFDPNDKFYMAPPAAGLLHYRTAAMWAGVLEVLLMIGASFVMIHFYANVGLTGLYSAVVMLVFMSMAIISTAIMIYAIVAEKPNMMYPKTVGLKLTISMLLIGAAISISSMSAGIETTSRLFSPFVNVHMMEDSLGPIWPFNLACVSFTGAAIAIWFHKLVDGCHEFLLDKKYFEARDNRSIEMSETKK
uniref:MARVEL domain-containing protein n=1 Tax=Panagrellus redivivus TaxID=6233 RepID=A0A7E4V0M9_PANRE